MSVVLRNPVSPWKSFLFELQEYDGFFPFIISCFKESVSQNNFNWSSSFLYQTQDIRQTLGLSLPIFLLTKVTIWTSQLLVQNWSKTPLSARSSVSRRIHVCPSTWQIWMITLTICYVNCFHLTITPIQTSSSPIIFGITTVFWENSIYFLLYLIITFFYYYFILIITKIGCSRLSKFYSTVQHQYLSLALSSLFYSSQATFKSFIDPSSKFV